METSASRAITIVLGRGICVLLLLVCIAHQPARADAGKGLYEKAEHLEFESEEPDAMAKAFKLYQEAAIAGSGAALVRLMDLYFTGDGTPKNDLNAAALAFLIERNHAQLFPEVKPQLNLLRKRLSEEQMERAEDIGSDLADDLDFSSLEQGELVAERKRKLRVPRGGWRFAGDATTARLKLDHALFAGGRISVATREPEFYMSVERVEWMAPRAYWPRFVVQYAEIDDDTDYRFSGVRSENPRPMYKTRNSDLQSMSERQLIDTRHGEMELWRLVIDTKPCFVFRYFPERVEPMSVTTGDFGPKSVNGTYCGEPGSEAQPALAVELLNALTFP